MDAIRCLECGDVRWSLIGLHGPLGTCELCGGEMVPERRRPSVTGGRPPVERRDLVHVGAGEPRVHPVA